MGMSHGYKKKLAAHEAFLRAGHKEPDADERGGPSDGDADNMGRRMKTRKRKMSLLHPAGLPGGQRRIAD